MRLQRPDCCRTDAWIALSHRRPTTDCVLTVSDVAYIVKNKGEIKIDKREMVHHSALDIQKKHGKSIYGSGFLISYTAAERVTAERAAVKKEAIVWELSEREMRIVEKLSGQ